MPGTTLVRVARAASAGGGKARYKVTDETILGRMHGTRRGDFARGMKGGAKGTFVRTAGGQQQPYLRQPLKRGYKAAAAKQTQYARHRTSFRAGERVGAAGGTTAAMAATHPHAVVYGTSAAVGGGLVAHDVRRARKQNQASAVAKSKAGSAALLGGITAASAAVPEAVRRGANKRGARISATDAYLTHPYKARYAQSAAYNRRYAEKAQSRSEAASNPAKKARYASRANRYRWSASANANAAREGAIASATAGANKRMKLNRYDASRHYDAPSGTIGVNKAMAGNDARLKHRKRLQAGTSTAGAVIGLGALGARGGASVARHVVADAAKGQRIAANLERKTNTGLALGAGIGALGGLNSAAISRAEAGPKPNKPDHIHLIGKAAEDKHLVRRYGLRGSPQGVDRETRQKIWEARSRHLNRKRNRWERTRQGANATEQGGKVVAGGVGALVAGHQLREAFTRENPEHMAHAQMATARHLMNAHPRYARPAAKIAHAGFHGKPGFKTMATGAAAAGVAGGARQLRVHAQKKTRKYSSASGGVASGTANRMKEYSVAKSAFGVEHTIAKADRRFKPERSSSPIYLARHTEQAVKLRTLKQRPLPAGAAIRETFRAARAGRI